MAALGAWQREVVSLELVALLAVDALQHIVQDLDVCVINTVLMHLTEVSMHITINSLKVYLHQISKLVDVQRRVNSLRSKRWNHFCCHHIGV